MKLVNKNTSNIKVLGEIVPCNVGEHNLIAIKTDQGVTWYYRTLAELNEEWEDYEEPEEYWFIDYDGGIIPFSRMKETATDRMMKQIGNYFDSREEAEKAVEKLKAWKRLKDDGFTISGWSHTPDMNLTTGNFITIKGFIPRVVKNIKDIDLLFGGEE